MNKIKKLIGGFAVVVLGTVGLSSCSLFGGSDDSASSDATVTVAINAEYTAINSLTAIGNTSYNSTVNYLTQENWTYFDKDLNYKVNENAVKITKTSDDPLTIEYKISDNATWSDGVPVTGDDLVLEWAGVSTNLNAELDEDTQFDEETGAAKPNADQVYFDGGDGVSEDIKKIPTVSDDGKTVTVVWDKSVPDWKYSFGGVTVPAHIIGKRYLGVDGVEGAKAVTTALSNYAADQTTDKDKVVKIANSWSNDWNIGQTLPDADFLVSNGAYTLTAFDGTNATLKKRDNYKGAVADTKIGTVVFRTIGDPAAAVQALQNGEVDIIQPDSPTADIISSIHAIGSDKVNYSTFQNGIFEHLDLQQSTKASNSVFSAAYKNQGEEKAVKVRNAFLKTIPRQDIVDKLVKPTDPNAKVLNAQTALQENPYYSQISENNGSSAFDTVDIDGAKALLAEAGLTNPSVSITYIKSKPNRVSEFQLIKESAEKAGFTVVDGGVQASEAGAAYGSGKYDANLFGWALTNTSFTNSKANFVTGGQNNFTNLNNPEIDDIWDQITQTDDQAKQAQLVTDSEKILWSTGFGVPLFQAPGVTASATRVQNVGTISIGVQAVYNFWEWEVK